ncbi:MAG: tRNA (adenosine(37)-N6)-dimethylallyltransferase MiaA [Candidatus Marinimicrobia bacterium]|nr:tRNA (adenosine(37)-N6)-dimethylallyltransferase MiaA [Candidatus Neomarinimicrobiota bacterium]
MNNEKNKSRCIFIVGPTASGKSALALDLAEDLHAEIISADSRQIFRGMDIGTATPSPEELNKVKHHFINERDPDEPFSAGEFGTLARKIIDEKMRSGGSVIICGGSGLYIRAILGMISDALVSDPGIRESIQDRLKKEGVEALYRELAEKDPACALGIDAKNPKRVCRALEIAEMTGRKPSEIFREPDPVFPWPQVMLGLAPERKLLYERIDRRVLDMIDAGWIEEVRALLDKGYDPGLNALNTVGYKEIIAYLKGKAGLEKTIGDIQKHTRHFAKRQMTWFRKYAPDHRIAFDREPAPGEILERAYALLGK